VAVEWEVVMAVGTVVDMGEFLSPTLVFVV